MAIDWEEAEAGAEVFKRGDTSGVPRETRDSIERTGVALKGPLETPVGFGEKSANVTLRKLFETYANIRPARQLPGVPTRYDGEGVDFIVVRENIEDLYAGVEYMQHAATWPWRSRSSAGKGSEKIIRYAFELARARGSRARSPAPPRPTSSSSPRACSRRIFEELAPEYPEIAAEHLIIDNVAHQMAKNPAQFDVIVTTNLAGDIISDLASGLVGGLGFAASGNYGDGVAIFEAVHGSAPKYAGKNVINPTALILSSVMMLRHLGETAAAQRIEDAVFVTLEEGKAMTLDVARQAGGDVEQSTSTTGFTDAVIANLGRRPVALPPRSGAERPSGPPPTPLPGWSYGADRDARIDAADGRRRHLHRDRAGARDRSGPSSSALAGDRRYRLDDRREPRHEGLPVGRADAPTASGCSGRGS